MLDGIGRALLNFKMETDENDRETIQKQGTVKLISICLSFYYFWFSVSNCQTESYIICLQMGNKFINSSRRAYRRSSPRSCHLESISNNFCLSCSAFFSMTYGFLEHFLLFLATQNRNLNPCETTALAWSGLSPHSFPLTPLSGGKKAKKEGGSIWHVPQVEVSGGISSALCLCGPRCGYTCAVCAWSCV